jgi:predicted transcriptional regulator
MEVHLTPEQETQLHQLANQRGKNAAQVLQEAVDRFLHEDAEFRAAVREGFAQIDRGEFIDEEEMDQRVARMLER